MSVDHQPADRVSVRRIVRDAVHGLKARFADVMALGAILLLPPGVLMGFVANNPDTAMLWVVLANLPLMVFEGAAIKLMHAALTGAPPPAAGDALKLGVSRLSQLFSIFALTFSPVLLALAGASLLGQAALLAAAPLIAAGAVALNLLLIAAQPLVMVEDMPAFPAMSLSARLTKGNRWPLLVVVVLMAVLSGLTYAVSYGVPAALALVAPKDIAQHIGDFVATPLVTWAVEPLGAALVTAAFVELRRSTVSVAARQARPSAD